MRGLGPSAATATCRGAINVVGHRPRVAGSVVHCFCIGTVGSTRSDVGLVDPCFALDPGLGGTLGQTIGENIGMRFVLSAEDSVPLAPSYKFCGTRGLVGTNYRM